MNQKNKEFEPRVMIAPVNTEVYFPNLDQIYHSIFSLNNIKKIDFIHVDVNIYSTSKKILEVTKKYMNKDSLILFDELVNYPFWWKNGEYKALTETYQKNEFKYLAFDRAKKTLIKIL